MRVIWALVGTLLSGLLVLVPLLLVIEGRAAGARAEAVAIAHDVLMSELAAGGVRVGAFPEWGRWPEAQVFEPLRVARCRTVRLDLPIAAEVIEGVAAHASLCVTSDRAAMRLFAVGLSWEDAAPIRRALPGLAGLYDFSGFAWLRPEQRGLLIRQEIWPS